MAEFATVQIAPHAYFINDPGQCSFYVVEGSERAAVIDTGITPGEQILPVVRKLTEKPLVLAVTHAHGDHMYHMDEFDTVYMSHRELELSAELLARMVGGKPLDLAKTTDIRTGSEIDLGGEVLEVCEVAGHTPGSVVFLAREQNLLFTGDAIGSGSSVWMQLPGTTSLEEYRDSLTHLLRWLVERGGRMRFYGGHHMQQFTSAAVSPYNPLNLGLLADLIDLVDQLLKGEVTGRPSSVNNTYTTEQICYASFGRAEIQYTKSKLSAR